MEILLWLVPPVLVTSAVAAGVAWFGREGRGVVDRDVAVRRLGEALAQPPRPRTTVAPPPAEPSGGVAVRPSRQPSRQRRAS